MLDKQPGQTGQKPGQGAHLWLVFLPWAGAKETEGPERGQENQTGPLQALDLALHKLVCPVGCFLNHYFNVLRF